MRYEKYINKCKGHKSAKKIHSIVNHILIGIRKGYDSSYLADRLNKYNILPLIAKKWTTNSLQMQLLKMKRLDEKSSLAWGLMHALSTGLATKEDMALLAARVR